MTVDRHKGLARKAYWVPRPPSCLGLARRGSPRRRCLRAPTRPQAVQKRASMFSSSHNNNSAGVIHSSSAAAAAAAAETAAAETAAAEARVEPQAQQPQAHLPSRRCQTSKLAPRCLCRRRQRHGVRWCVMSTKWTTTMTTMRITLSSLLGLVRLLLRQLPIMSARPSCDSVVSRQLVPTHTWPLERSAATTMTTAASRRRQAARAHWTRHRRHGVTLCAR